MFEVHVACKRRFFHAAMHAGLLKGFESGRLCVGQTRFDVSLGKGPAPAPGLHQEKLNAFGAHTVAHGRDLLVFLQTAKMRDTNSFRSSPCCQRADVEDPDVNEVLGCGRHDKQSARRQGFWLEPSVVRLVCGNLSAYLCPPWPSGYS